MSSDEAKCDLDPNELADRLRELSGQFEDLRRRL